MRKRITSAQLAIFFPLSDIFGLGPEPIESVTQELKDALMFEGRVDSLPIFPGIPNDIPRLIFNTTNDLERYQIAGNRIDIFLNKPTGDTEIADIADDFGRIYNLLSNFLMSKGVTLKRVGLVVNYDLLEIESPISFIRERFIINEAVDSTRLKEIAIRYNESENFVSSDRTILLNNVFSITSDGNKSNLVIDINTSSEAMENMVLSNIDINNFISNSVVINNQWCHRNFTE